MIAVTDAWKAAHEGTLLPETFIEVTYAVTEPGLQEDTSSVANLEESWSEAETLVSTLSRSREKYNTLEWNIWGLDGSCDYYDGSPVNPGYTTYVQADSDAVYSSLPTITVTLGSVHTELIPGITVTWSEEYNEWASRFRVTAYNGDTVVAQKTVEDNAVPVSAVWMDIQNFNRVVIEVLEWGLPHHRARAAAVFLGIRQVYTKDDLLSYTHSQTVDLLSAALPKNEIKFALRNEDARWNPDNPTGVEQYLLERQEIKVRYGMDVNGSKEWIDGGKFWLNEWNTPANGLEASFTARDALEFMGEVYTGPRTGTLLEIATAAFEQANLPILGDGSKRYYVSGALTFKSTDFSGDDNEYTIAEVLQMVAHAGMCVLFQDRDGRVNLKEHAVALTDYVIDRNVSYAHPEFTISKPLKSVVVSYADDQKVTVQVGTSGEVQTVDNVMIRTADDARAIGDGVGAVLGGRKTISGEFRADPRMDALDIITVESKYARNTVTITEVEYTTTGGAMSGRYTGRVSD